MDAVKRWYDSAENQEASQVRQSGARFRIISDPRSSTCEMKSWEWCQLLALTGGARRLQTFSAVEGRPAVLWS
jgi:hypothetical protein